MCNSAQGQLRRHMYSTLNITSITGLNRITTFNLGCHGFTTHYCLHQVFSTRSTSADLTILNILLRVIPKIKLDTLLQIQIIRCDYADRKPGIRHNVAHSLIERTFLAAREYYSGKFITFSRF